MTQTAILTKWKFVVEFEDEETKEISGAIGQADTREECEGLIEYDMQYHSSHGRTVLNVEGAEICVKCEGEGKIPAGNGGQVICDACGGHLGPISKLDIRWITSGSRAGGESLFNPASPLTHQPDFVIERARKTV
jgi:hypothetical protein